MRFVFQTSNINERLYHRLVRINLYSQFTNKKKRKEFFKRLENYTFYFRPSWMASEDPFFDKNGVGGITDAQKTIFYVEDKKTVDTDAVKRVLRQNAIVISHENGHLKGLFNGNTDRKPLRHTDESGNVQGTLLPEYVQEVHDRDIENRSFVLSFWFWDWKKLIPHHYNVKVIDFRDVFEDMN